MGQVLRALHFSELFGVQVMLRVKDRKTWWLSKCVWAAASTFIYFSVMYMSALVLCLFTHTEITLEDAPLINEAIHGQRVMLLFILPVMTALENINITFRDGTVYGLRGINGSGKTMLMRAVSGLIYPTDGKVIIDGKCLGIDMSFPEHLGLLLENPAFFDGYTGYKNLELLVSLGGNPSPDQISRSLQRVGLNPGDRRKYRKYSLGMKQRLGIAAAILEEPEILIFDEPLNALDTEGVALFSDIMDAERKIRMEDKEQL